MLWYYLTTDGSRLYAKSVEFRTSSGKIAEPCWERRFFVGKHSTFQAFKIDKLSTIYKQEKTGILKFYD